MSRSATEKVPANHSLMRRSKILDPNHREYREAADRAFAVLLPAVQASVPVFIGDGA